MLGELALLNSRARGAKNNLQRVKTRQEQQFFRNAQVDRKKSKKITHAFENLIWKSVYSNFSNEHCRLNQM